jgi:hypothetical protein
MSSPINPISNPARLGVAFWLPPFGIDNGVWASNWAELADLEADDVGPVLRLLARAGVGGYVAIPRGRRSRHRLVIHRLWVDSLQYHRAEDVLMVYFNNHDSR